MDNSYYLVKHRGWDDWEIVVDDNCYIPYYEYEGIIEIKKENLIELREQIEKIIVF